MLGDDVEGEEASAFFRSLAQEHLELGDACKARGELALALSHYERSLAYDYASPRARTLAAELRAGLSFHDSTGHPTVSLPTDRLGAAATRYSLLREIGRGGMGAVYLAEDARLGRRVALKVFHRIAGRDSSKIDRMLDEARIVSAIGHPAIVRILDLHPDNRIIVMEHLRGSSLRDRLRREKTLSSFMVGVLASSLASALEAIHDHGLVHGDLKPANVLFREVGPEALADPVLADFGLARIVERAQTGTDPAPENPPLPGAPISRRPSGTLAFMAPEQRRGATPSVSTDLYALGVILFEALKGHLPFDERALLSSTLPLPRALPPEVPEKLRRLVFDLLASSPSARPKCAGEVITRLTALR